MKHEQIKVAHPVYGSIHVDKGIVHLLEALWRIGIDTALSCQENRPGIMWIDFTTADDFALFLNIIANADEELYYHYIEAQEDGWSFNVCPWNLSEYVDEEADEVKRDGPPKITFSISVRFPASQYERIYWAVNNTSAQYRVFEEYAQYVN